LFAGCAGILLAVAAHLGELSRASLLLRAWPNLALFDAEGVLAAGSSVDGLWLLGLGGYWAAYMLLLAGVASYIFQRREF
jgi:hypothetical protein